MFYRNKRVAWLALIMLFGIALISGCTDSTNKTQKPEQSKTDTTVNNVKKEVANQEKKVAQQKPKTKEQTLEEFIRNIPALKYTQNMDKKKPHLKSLTIDNEGVIIEYNPDESFSINTQFVASNVNDIIKELSKRKDLKKVNINMYMTLTDTYGNKQDVNISNFEISQEKLSKINFKNFDYMNLPNVADRWWTDPRAIEK